MANLEITDQAFGIVPILRQDGHDRVLLVQHRAGHWGFPKGHAEPGETAIETACREFEEETGISAYTLISETSFSESYKLLKKDRLIKKTVVYFTAFVQSAEVRYQEKEIQDYIWLSFEAALERITFTQSRQLLTQVRQHLQNW